MLNDDLPESGMTYFLKSVTIEVTFNPAQTCPETIRERIEGQTGVWDTDNISDS